MQQTGKYLFVSWSQATALKNKQDLPPTPTTPGYIKWYTFYQHI